YRDRALVRQRVEFTIAPAASATVRVKIAAGVDPEDVMVIERDHFTIRELHAPVSPPPADEDAAPPPAEPKDVELVIAAPDPGRYAIHLAYITDRITWEAAYTMTTTPAREHATVRG